MQNRHDVVVVGAGVFGLSSAWQLAAAGLSVVVVDRAPVGTEASGWALGRLDPLLRGSGSTGETERDLPAEHIAKPKTQQELAFDSFRLHRDREQEIQRVSGIDLQVDHQPTLQLFYSEAELEAGRKYAAEWTAGGFKSDIVGPDEIRSIDGRISTTEFGGSLVNGPYFLDSLNFVRALAACAGACGVRLETAVVKSVEQHPRGGGVTVHTDQGHYEAATAVITAGPWSVQLAEPFGVKVPVSPSKGEILRLTPPAGDPLRVHVHGPCSLVLKKDGHVWVAATASVAGFDRTPTDEAREQLLENARTMLPPASEWPVAMHTVCFRPATPDDLPVLGRVSDDVLVASGGGGSGIVHCLLVGEDVAAMVAGGADRAPHETISLGRFTG